MPNAIIGKQIQQHLFTNKIAATIIAMLTNVTGIKSGMKPFFQITKTRNNTVKVQKEGKANNRKVGIWLDVILLIAVITYHTYKFLFVVWFIHVIFLVV